MSITILGLGAGDLTQISLGAFEELKSNKKIYLRTEKHPIVEKLNISYESFDKFYDSEEKFELVYDKIANFIVDKGKEEDIIYAVPGHPRVAEKTVSIIEKKAKEKNISLKIIASMSFVDAMFSSLGVDPSEGFTLVDAFDLKERDLNSKHNLIITQVYDRFIASNVKIELQNYYEDEVEIAIVKASGVRNLEEIKYVKLYELDNSSNEFDHLTSLFILKDSKKKFKDIFDLKDITKKLRSEEGCPWDRAQSHDTLKKYIIEEAYEVFDAIDNDDIEGLIEELGDLLYHIVIHSEIGIEEGYFDFNEVCNNICEKMVNRHPQVFSLGEKISWEEQKRIEKGENTISESINRIPSSIPALIKAEKIQEKASKGGFEWKSIEDAMKKVKEEYIEFINEIDNKDFIKMQEEFGDLLFSLVKVARFLNIDSEYALNLTNKKFSKRFEYVELEIIKRGETIKNIDLSTLMDIWEESKNKN